MNIILISDLEGYNLDTLISSISLEDSIDLIITLGDLSPSILTRLDTSFKHIPKLGVLGNHDNRKDFNNLSFINLNNKRYLFKGLSFVGNEGCLPYNDNLENNVFKSDFEVNKGLSDLCLHPIDFLISHNSPLGIHDNAQDMAHKGYAYLRELIYYETVSIIFHGHQHVNKLSKVNNTLVIGIYGCVMFNTKTLAFKEITYTV